MFVPKGSATKIISYISKDFNNTFTKFDPYILARMGKIQYGFLDLNSTNLAKIDFLKALANAKPISMDITLIPGETTVVFLKDISKKNNLSFEKLMSEFQKNAPIKEGYLVPDTYKFLKGDSEESIIKKLLDVAKKRQNNLEIKYFKDTNSTRWNEILIKASIIQKEAGNIQEMPIVSSVIENRLKNNMKLQMDGTLNYGEFSHTKVTAQRIKDDKSKFNTYLNEGLPPMPICNVSKEAILAAIHPKKTEFLYFVKDKNSTGHIFSKSYKEHEKNIFKQ